MDLIIKPQNVASLEEMLPWLLTLPENIGELNDRHILKGGNMLKIIELLLASSVMAAICSGFINRISDSAKKRVNYTVEKNEKWEEKINIVIDELSNAKNRKEIYCTLEKLKKYINPYGKNKKDNIIEETHIWNLIEKMENAVRYKEIEQDKEIMIMYLLFLVKFKRDKTEKILKSRPKDIIINIALVSGAIYAIIMHFFVCKFEYNEEFLMTLVIFLGVPFILPMVVEDINITKREMKKNYRRWKIFGYICFSIFVIIQILRINRYYGITLEYLASSEGYIEGTIVLVIIGTIFSVSMSREENDLVKKYMNAVKEIQKNEN